MIVRDEQSGRLAAIDKLTFMSPTETWLEGLRVAPEYRGRGLAAAMERYFIHQARGAGGTKTAPHDAKLETSPFTEIPSATASLCALSCGTGSGRRRMSALLRQEERFSAKLRLLQCLTHGSPGPYGWWKRTPSFLATDGLLNCNWSFSATGAEEWGQRAEQGTGRYLKIFGSANLKFPPPMALVRPQEDAPGALTWMLSIVSAVGEEWSELAAGVLLYERRQRAWRTLKRCSQIPACSTLRSKTRVSLPILTMIAWTMFELDLI